MNKGNSFFITGGTGFIGKRVVQRILKEGGIAYVLARENSASKLVSYLSKKKINYEPYQLRFVKGDLSSADIVKDKIVLPELRRKVKYVIHCGAVYDLSIPRGVAREINVDGTRGIIEFASSIKNLKKFCHISTIAVSGDYQGIFYEEMLDVGQSFTDHYGRTKFLAEKLIREWTGRVPITIVRPGAVVGDSKTGEIEKFDGPYFVMKLLYLFKHIHLITPGSDRVYLEVVPVDFLANLIVDLTLDSLTTEKTFCIVDPEPMTLSEFIDRVYEYLKTYKPLLKMSLKPVSTIFRTPVLGNVLRYGGRKIGYPAEGIFYIIREVIHDMSNTLKYCDSKGIKIPKFNDYFDRIVEYFEKTSIGKK